MPVSIGTSPRPRSKVISVRPDRIWKGESSSANSESRRGMKARKSRNISRRRRRGIGFSGLELIYCRTLLSRSVGFRVITKLDTVVSLFSVDKFFIARITFMVPNPSVDWRSGRSGRRPACGSTVACLASTVTI